MTTVNGWESLIVDTKISILVALGVLDSPLCVIEMSKLKKQHNSETRYYLINILLKFRPQFVDTLFIVRLRPSLSMHCAVIIIFSTQN